ncbi:MAG: DUF1634 domain-containing protein [Ignavibacteria bacterium]|nr:DUF1634 domain-containing protein [Ignavibacteria bacterium]
MLKSTKSWDDKQMSSVMGSLLRVGVLLSALLVIVGGVIFLIQHPHETFNYSAFKGEPARFRQVNLIIQEALNFRGRSIIQLGLILLIATPVARVIFSLFGFLFEKDWTYVVITFIVLTILLNSLLTF